MYVEITHNVNFGQNPIDKVWYVIGSERDTGMAKWKVAFFVRACYGSVTTLATKLNLGDI
jgi:hypothetical protein